MKITRLTLLLVLLLAFLLSACGDDDKDSDDGGNDNNENSGGNTAAALPLTQTFFQSDFAGLNLSAKYPENWVTGVEGAVIFASSQTVLEKAKAADRSLASGEVFVRIIPLSAGVLDGNTAFTPAALVEIFRQEQAELASQTPQAGETAEPFANIGANEDLTLNGKSGTKISYTFSNGQVEGTMYSVQYSDNLILALIGLAHVGEWENYAATAEAVIASFEIQLGSATEEATEAP